MINVRYQRRSDGVHKDMVVQFPDEAAYERFREWQGELFGVSFHHYGNGNYEYRSRSVVISMEVV